MKKLYFKVIRCFNGIASDKQQHFIVSLILCAVIGIAFGWFYGFLITIAIGVFKECIIDDVIMKNKADIEDIEYDFYGAVGGVVLLILVTMVEFIFR